MRKRFKTKIADIIQKIKNFVTFNDEDECLAKDLRANIQAIREINSEILINDILVPQIRREILEKEGYLITDEQAVQGALNIFLASKINGTIDELNSLIF